MQNEERRKIILNYLLRTQKILQALDIHSTLFHHEFDVAETIDNLERMAQAKLIAKLNVYSHIHYCCYPIPELV